MEGLVSGGPAERAGLREDMRVVDRENSEPWRGRWDPDRPTIVVVDEHGSRRRFEVRAAGATVAIPEFTPTGEGESGESPN